MIAAACVSFIYGPENDLAYELALSTPTSPRTILLARLALVFGYNLGLVPIATLGLQPALHQQLFETWCCLAGADDLPFCRAGAFRVDRRQMRSASRTSPGWCSCLAGCCAHLRQISGCLHLSKRS